MTTNKILPEIVQLRLDLHEIENGKYGNNVPENTLKENIDLDAIRADSMQRYRYGPEKKTDPKIKQAAMLHGRAANRHHDAANTHGISKKQKMNHLKMKKAHKWLQHHILKTGKIHSKSKQAMDQTMKMLGVDRGKEE